VGSSPDNDEAGRHSQTVRARQAKREGVREEPASESLSIECTGSNLGDAGRDSSARYVCFGGRATPSVGIFLAGPEATSKVCGVGVAMLQGHSWAPNPLTVSW
jgi:hypothetical protein